MTDRDARREAISLWLIEFSVLWAVFPVLDRVVENRALGIPLMSASIGFSLTALVLGLILKRGERT